MNDSFDDPEEAHLALKSIMEDYPKRKISDHIGDFNQIAVYLERQIRKKKEGEKVV